MTRLRTEADVVRAGRVLEALMPRGRLLRVEPGSRFEALLQALAGVLADVELRLLDLVDESDPRTTYELLEEWERTLGLPGECLGEPLPTLSLRRLAILARLRRGVEQSAADLVWLASALGFQVEVFEPRPFRCGVSSCGDGLWNEASVWTFYVHAAASSPVFATCGDSTCGQRITDWNNLVLECEVGSWKPAHTVAHHVYDLPPAEAGPWSILYPPPLELVLDFPPGLVTVLGSL